MGKGLKAVMEWVLLVLESRGSRSMVVVDGDGDFLRVVLRVVGDILVGWWVCWFD